MTNNKWTPEVVRAWLNQSLSDIKLTGTSSYPYATVPAVIYRQSLEIIQSLLDTNEMLLTNSTTRRHPQATCGPKCGVKCIDENIVIHDCHKCKRDV